jgi:hypothetical protein
MASDILVLEEALVELYLARKSCSKPSIMTAQVFRITTHNECKLPEELVHQQIKCSKNDGVDTATSGEDYSISLTPVPGVEFEPLIDFGKYSKIDKFSILESV